jgi:two-component system response regulator
MKINKEIEIILVEDNPNDIEMIMESFRDQNIGDKVHILKNGAEVLDYFFDHNDRLERGFSEQPKVIILDLKLPKVSGFEVLKRLKSDNRTKNIPVVIFTSSDEESDRIESYRLGANSYAVKPLDSEAFARVISEIGRYWLFMNKPSHDTP